MEVVSSDVTNSTTSFADVTGLSFAVTSGQTYAFQAKLLMTAAATTTGVKVAINGPTASIMAYMAETATTATTSRIDYQAAYDSGGPSAQTPTGGTFYATVEGVVTASANGTVTVRFASEVASSAVVVKAGSCLFWRRTL